MAMVIKTVAPDLVSGMGKVVFSAEEGRTSVTVANIDMPAGKGISATDLDQELRSEAKALLQQAIEALQ